MKKIIIILLIAISPLIINGQNEKELDSIINSILKIENDSTRISKITENSIVLLRCEETAYNYFKTELNKIKSRNNDDNNSLSTMYELLSVSKYRSQEYDSAIFFTKKQIPYIQKLKDSILLFRAINRYAVLYEAKSDYLTSTKYYIESAKIAGNLKNVKYELTTRLNLGGLYLKMERYEESLEQFNKAKSILDTVHNIDVVFRIVTPLNLGAIYLQMSELDSAYKYCNKSLKLAIKNKTDEYVSLSCGNISRIFKKKQLIDSSIYYQNKSYIIKKNTSDYNGMLESLLFMTKTYCENGRYNEAFEIQSLTIDLLPRIEAPDLLESAYYVFASLNAKTNNYKRAYEQIFKAFYTKDTILNTEKQNQIFDLETKYKTQQKENEILRLNNEINNKKATLAQSRLLNILGAGLMLIIIFAGLFLWHRKKQQIKIIILQNSIQAGEMEKKRIGRELHDGIAAALIKLAKDIENKNPGLSDHLFNTYNEVRSLSHQLNNSPIQGEAFIDRLIDLIPLKNNDWHIYFRINPLTLEIEEPAGTHLYRIIQELIVNNIKHAEATVTKINLSLEKGSLHLSYEDNGIGITDFKKGNGFNNMESRIELMRGKMQVLPHSLKGLKIEINIPYHNEED